MTIVKKTAQKAAVEPVPRRAISNHRVLNEAYDYARPSSFSRGKRVDLLADRVL